MSRKLILHFPVLHKGYLDFLEKYKNTVSEVYLIPDRMIEDLSDIKPDLASIPTEKAISLLRALGYPNIGILSAGTPPSLLGEPLLLVDDRVSRALRERYFPENDVEMASVFLRWDADSIHKEEDLSIPETKDKLCRSFMALAQAEARKSSDWWRQVGAVLEKDGKVLASAFNEAMPSDHTPYQRGAVRDFLEPGVSPELVDTIHAEQKLIADAAKKGTSLNGVSLYITHFPCPVCAKLITASGIANCYFSEGWSTLAGGKILELAGVKCVRVI